MRRLSMIACLMVLVASAVSSAAKAARYQGVALGNSSAGSQVPEHRFVTGDGYSLRFRDTQGQHTSYRVCLTHDGVDTYCAKGRTGARKPAGWSQHVLYATAPKPGSGYAYRWYVGGRMVARWAVTIGQGD